jgi:thiazolinyl imide reductase
VVAGTAFGRIYLDAIGRAADSFALAGILARGSDFSARLAARYGVPLYTDPDEAGDVDIACVVVRSGTIGGPGSDLARSFLRRGVHVMQEHPVHPDELAQNLRAAREGDAAYTVHTLYPDLAPVRSFLAAAAVLRQENGVAFLDAACNSQVAYPLLDVLGRAAGSLRPWAFGAVRPVDPAVAEACADAQPFQVLHAAVGGIPLTLRVQNQVHPEDPDNHSHLLHRITVGGDAGVLTLADTHGPVLWNPRLHSPRDETGRLLFAGAGTERLTVPSTSALGPEPGTLHEVFSVLWPDAVARALERFAADIRDPRRRVHSGQWALAVSRAWSDLTAVLGVPELIRPGEPPVLPPDAFEEAGC